MEKYICDKCGKECGAYGYYRPYSFSKGRQVGLCRSCIDKLGKAIKKADADFFKEKGE